MVIRSDTSAAVSFNTESSLHSRGENVEVLWVQSSVTRSDTKQIWQLVNVFLPLLSEIANQWAASFISTGHAHLQQTNEIQA